MDELKRLLQEFSQKYGELGERIAKDIWTLVGQGKTPEEAVKLVLDANHLEEWLSETVSSIVIQTASTQLSPSLVAAITAEEFKRALSLPWDGSGMTLSEKIHGAGLDIRKRITSVLKEQLQWNQTTRQMAQALYDGYHASHVTHQQSLPKYVQKLMTAYRRNQGAISPKDYEAIMRQLRNVQRQYDGLVNDTVTYNHFKTTLAGLTDAILKGNDKAVWNALWQAVQEKSRYVAERIARTEGARAWYDGFQAQYGTDDRVPAYRWRLGSRHPHFDICDLYAEADLYGLGKGIFPKDKAPPLPAHPHCLCHYSPIYASELAGKKEKDQVQAGGMDFINKMKPIDRMALLGRAGIKGVAEGGEWTKYARGYSADFMKSRLITVLDSTSGQNYKSVVIDSNDNREDVRRGQVIRSQRVESNYPNLYISDTVHLKPRQLHEVEKRLAEAFRILHMENAADKPKVILSDVYEMGNSGGTYYGYGNILYINISKGDFPQTDTVFAKDPVSTYVHELIHWMDAREYVKRHGEITSAKMQQAYIAWIRNKGEQVIEQLIKKGYNIDDVSKYASKALDNGYYDEFYTEYRVLNYMQGK